jgi:hypothetical protein
MRLKKHEDSAQHILAQEHGRIHHGRPAAAAASTTHGAARIPRVTRRRTKNNVHKGTQCNIARRAWLKNELILLAWLGFILLVASASGQAVATR